MLVFPLLFSAGLHSVSATDARIDKDEYFQNDSWRLIPAENKIVSTLSDLKDGVYFLELSSIRSECGPAGPGTWSCSR